MSRERQQLAALPGMKEAVGEIKAAIRERFPQVAFRSRQGDDPQGLYLTVVVDTDDAEAVVDVYIDRLVELQVERGLPLYVVPVRSPEHAALQPTARRARTAIPAAPPAQ